MPIAQKEDVEVNVVGGSVYGRYPKISDERTYNMFISDDWLINYAGFKKRARIPLSGSGNGRGFFNSIRGGFLIVVEGNSVYRLGTNLAPVFISEIDTNSGFVSIDENLLNQICIVDGKDAYIYNYIQNTFTKQTLFQQDTTTPIIPGYVEYQNTFFLIGSSLLSINPENWYVFQRSTDSTIAINSEGGTFKITTKPDSALVVKRLPGRSNNILVMGSTVAEVWTQVGGKENYRKVQSFNIDNGVVSASTVAANDEFLCWLSQNENNAPSIMFTDGSTAKRLSTDGIDYVLSQIQYPQQSVGFFYRQDGHTFYQLTFFNDVDNLTLIYDFSSQMFFNVTDENLNYHPARQVVFFNENTYFVSLRDADIYQMDTDFVTYDYEIASSSVGKEIPRVRICKAIRRKNSSPFRVKEFTFWLEQGVNDFYLVNPDNVLCNGLVETEDGQGLVLTEDGQYIALEDAICIDRNISRPRVDMSFSKNGNQSFSNIVGKELNPAGKYQNRIRWHRMGRANEFTIQLRFWGFQRMVAGNGIATIR